MRYSDTKHSHSDTAAFAVRKRVPTILQFSLSFWLSFLAIYGLYFLASSQIEFGLALALITALISSFVVYSVQRSRDLAMATEFQNALFASALGLGSAFCVIVRRDGTIVYSDRGFQRFFPEHGRLGDGAIDAVLEMWQVSKEDAQRVFAAINSGEDDRVVFSLRLHGGEMMRMMMTVNPVHRPAEFVILRGREYVEHRGANASAASAYPGLAIASELLAPMVSTAPFGLYATDARGKLVYVNRTLEAWLGFAPDEMADAHLGMADLVDAEASHMPSGLAAFEGDVWLRGREGVPVLLGIRQEIQHGANGAVIGTSGVVELLGEASALKKKALKLTEAGGMDALDAFLAHSPLAVVRLDSEGIIRGANHSFLILSQQSIVNPLGAPFAQLFPEEGRAESEVLLKSALGGQFPATPVALELLLPNGARVMVSAFFSRLDATVHGSQDTIVQLLDTTEQKNLEMRFAHSQKMQAVGQLAGGVAHDFNNLLTAMIGFCDLLLMRHPAGDQSFADIMQVKQNANRAANLVRQLLAFSRRQTLQPKTLDITDVLAELSNLVRRLIGENIELKMVHGRDVGMVKADQGQLEQVIINLAVNARDAMLKGGTLTIRTSRAKIGRRSSVPRGFIAPSEEDAAMVEGEYVLVEVSDTGSGIPAAIVQKIFEPFFSTKEVGSGTGLGLSTVYGIIKQTGGYIYVSSEEGKGTTFAMYFPSVAADEKIQAQESESVDKSAGMDLTGKDTILLVEDETPVRIFAGRALRNKGYTVLEADCGETGLEIMRTHGHEVHLIVTDVIMPGINGPTMVDTILQSNPNIKVIFISGYAEDIFMNNYGTERSFNFLAKPFTLKQLATKVKEVLQGK